MTMPIFSAAVDALRRQREEENRKAMAQGPLLSMGFLSDILSSVASTTSPVADALQQKRKQEEESAAMSATSRQFVDGVASGAMTPEEAKARMQGLADIASTPVPSPTSDLEAQAAVSGLLTGLGSEGGQGTGRIDFGDGRSATLDESAYWSRMNDLRNQAAATGDPAAMLAAMSGIDLAAGTQVAPSYPELNPVQVPGQDSFSSHALEYGADPREMLPYLAYQAKNAAKPEFNVADGYIFDKSGTFPPQALPMTPEQQAKAVNDAWRNTGDAMVNPLTGERLPIAMSPAEAKAADTAARKQALDEAVASQPAFRNVGSGDMLYEMPGVDLGNGTPTAAGAAAPKPVATGKTPPRRVGLSMTYKDGDSTVNMQSYIPASLDSALKANGGTPEVYQSDVKKLPAFMRGDWSDYSAASWAGTRGRGYSEEAFRRGLMAEVEKPGFLDAVLKDKKYSDSGQYAQIEDRIRKIQEIAEMVRQDMAISNVEDLLSTEGETDEMKASATKAP